MIRRAQKSKKHQGSITRSESFHSLLLGEDEGENEGNKNTGGEDPLAGVLDLGSESTEDEKRRPFINTSTIAKQPFVMKKQSSGFFTSG